MTPRSARRTVCTMCSNRSRTTGITRSASVAYTGLAMNRPYQPGSGDAVGYGQHAAVHGGDHDEHHCLHAPVPPEPHGAGVLAKGHDRQDSDQRDPGGGADRERPEHDESDGDPGGIAEPELAHERPPVGPERRRGAGDQRERAGEDARHSAREELGRTFLSGALTADEVLRRHCTLVFAETGNYVEAARRLGIDRRTVKERVDLALVKRLRGEG
jgi:hypothetical protein